MKYLIMIIGVILIAYISCTFITLTLNIKEWSLVTRTACLVGAYAGVLIGILFIRTEENC